jgi:hypothetical protein
MNREGVRVNALYEESRADLWRLQTDGTHFNRSGEERLGRKTAEALRAAIRSTGGFRQPACPPTSGGVTAFCREKEGSHHPRLR